MTWMQRLKRVFAIDIETCPKCGGKLRASPASKIPMSSPRPRARSCSRGSHNCPCESTSAQHRAPRRANTRTAPVENDRLTPCCDRYTSNRRFARPFRLQRPPPHPQRAQRTPLKTSPERPVNQPYFATIPFRAVIRPIRYHPGFPGRFHDITAAIAFCRTFFPWYNTEHRHGGIAMLTPNDVHHHRTRSALDQRGRILQAPDPSSRTLRSRDPTTRSPSPSGLDQSTRDIHNRRDRSVNSNRQCLKVVDRFRFTRARHRRTGSERPDQGDERGLQRNELVAMVVLWVRLVRFTRTTADPTAGESPALV